jgi:hypothetical protein
VTGSASRLRALARDWRHFVARDGASALPTVAREVAGLGWLRAEFMLMRWPAAPAPPLPSDVGVRPFETSDVAIVRERFRPSEADVCAMRLDLGHHGLVVEQAGSFRGYNFCSDDVAPSVERIVFRLAPGELFSADTWITPDARSGGLGRTLLAAAAANALALGRDAVVGLVDTVNPGSVKAHRALGAVTVGEASYRRVLGHRHSELVRRPAPDRSRDPE